MACCERASRHSFPFATHARDKRLGLRLHSLHCSVCGVRQYSAWNVTICFPDKAHEDEDSIEDASSCVDGEGDTAKPDSRPADWEESKLTNPTDHSNIRRLNNNLMAAEFERVQSIRALEQQNRGSVLKQGRGYQETMRREVQECVNGDHDYGKVDDPDDPDELKEDPRVQANWQTARKDQTFEGTPNYQYFYDEFKPYQNQMEIFHRTKPEPFYAENLNYDCIKSSEMYLPESYQQTNGEGLGDLKQEDPYADRAYGLNGTSPQSSSSSNDVEGSRILNLSGVSDPFRIGSVLTNMSERTFEQSPSPNGHLHSLDGSPVMHQHNHSMQSPQDGDCLNLSNLSPHRDVNASDCDPQVRFCIII